MACEICGKSGCCRSFHSLEEQEAFDRIAEPVKEKIHGDLMYDFKRLDTVDVDGEDYVKLSDVENMIENNV